MAVREPASSRYGRVTGLPELNTLIKRKLEDINHLPGQDVMVTMGANQVTGCFGALSSVPAPL